MKSPFPGMDPFLETRWGDVHTRLNIYASDMLSRSLPPGLVARCEERSIVCEFYGAARDIYPDVSVIERAAHESFSSGGGVALAESECLLLPATSEITQRFLEIRDASAGGRIVTVIEFVSPTNKRSGDGLDKYLKKQRECIDGDINLVEIDLTREGSRELIMPLSLELRDRTTYAATVRRAGQQDRIWLYKLPLEKRLGGVPVPLRTTDTDLVLDLQNLIDQVYENGRYGDDLTYRENLRPPLTSEQAAWVEELLANRG